MERFKVIIWVNSAKGGSFSWGWPLLTQCSDLLNKVINKCIEKNMLCYEFIVFVFLKELSVRIQLSHPKVSHNRKLCQIGSLTQSQTSLHSWTIKFFSLVYMGATYWPRSVSTCLLVIPLVMFNESNPHHTPHLFSDLGKMKGELAWQCKEIWQSGSLIFTGNQIWVPCMFA